MKISCCIYATWIIEVPIRECIRSIGFANVCLHMQIVKAIISLFALIMTLSQGVLAIEYGSLCCALINILVSAYYGKKYIDYSISELSSDVIPSITIGIIMSIIVSLIPNGIESPLLCLFIQIFIGALLYVCLAFFSKNRFMNICLGYLKQYIKI